MKFVNNHSACGTTHAILEMEDKDNTLFYFHTQEGISVHNSVQNVHDCLADRCTFHGKLHMQSRAIPIAQDIIEAEDTPEFIRAKMEKYIKEWRKN